MLIKYKNKEMNAEEFNSIEEMEFSLFETINIKYDPEFTGNILNIFKESFCYYLGDTSEKEIWYFITTSLRGYTNEFFISIEKGNLDKDSLFILREHTYSYNHNQEVEIDESIKKEELNKLKEIDTELLNKFKELGSYNVIMLLQKGIEEIKEELKNIEKEKEELLRERARSYVEQKKREEEEKRLKKLKMEEDYKIGIYNTNRYRDFGVEKNIVNLNEGKIELLKNWNEYFTFEETCSMSNRETLNTLIERKIPFKYLVGKGKINITYEGDKILGDKIQIKREEIEKMANFCDGTEERARFVKKLSKQKLNTLEKRKFEFNKLTFPISFETKDGENWKFICFDTEKEIKWKDIKDTLFDGSLEISCRDSHLIKFFNKIGFDKEILFENLRKLKLLEALC